MDIVFAVSLNKVFFRGKNCHQGKKDDLVQQLQTIPFTYFHLSFKHYMFKDLIYCELSLNLNYLIRILKKLSRKSIAFFHDDHIVKNVKVIDIWPHFCFKIPCRYFVIPESLRSQGTCFRILITFSNVRNCSITIQYHLFEGF